MSNSDVHISVGAVVYTLRDKIPHVLLLYREKTGTYHLPKGTQEAGETHEETAKREIFEETGCVVELENELGYVFSSFFRNGSEVSKQTFYFRAKYISGKPIISDGEHDVVDFYPIDSARKLLCERGAYRLGYEDERGILGHFENS